MNTFQETGRQAAAIWKRADLLADGESQGHILARFASDKPASIGFASVASVGFARAGAPSRLLILRGLAAGPFGFSWLRLASLLLIFAHFSHRFVDSKRPLGFASCNFLGGVGGPSSGRSSAN